TGSECSEERELLATGRGGRKAELARRTRPRSLHKRQDLLPVLICQFFYEATLAVWCFRRDFPCDILSLPAVQDVVSAGGRLERALCLQRHRRGCVRILRSSTHRRSAA